jgi:hypothetical protein
MTERDGSAAAGEPRGAWAKLGCGVASLFVLVPVGLVVLCVLAIALFFRVYFGGD